MSGGFCLAARLAGLLESTLHPRPSGRDFRCAPSSDFGGREILDVMSADRSARCRHHRRDLDLHLRPVLDQRDHLHRRPRDGVDADQLAEDGADLARALQVLALVDQLPGHAGDVLGPGTGLGQHGSDVQQRLRHPGPRLPAPALRRLRQRQAAGVQLQAARLLPR